MPPVNPLGVDVDTLDVELLLAVSRRCFAVAALAWLALLLLVRRPLWLLLGVFLANAWLWGVTNYPLQRLYAFDVGFDRTNSLAMVQVVAAGNSPLYTPMDPQVNFEPFWTTLVAGLSGWSPDRVLLLYPFLPLAVVLAFGATLYVGLRSPEPGRGWSAWERALVAGSATLLCSTPYDYLEPYRVPWSLMFLLKPNHALGLVLAPLVLGAFVRIRSWKGRVGTALLLHVLGWAFVLHMVYLSAGLIAFALLALLGRQPGARRDVADTIWVVGVNLAVVSPYLVLLFLGYPFLVSGPRYTVDVAAHLLQPFSRVGWILPLGIWGAVAAWKTGGRLGRVWTSQLVAGFGIWLGYPLLNLVQLAREPDELFLWCRFLLAASAGLGAWDLASRLLQEPLWQPVRRATLVAALGVPLAVPYWWDPLRMDVYFRNSLEPLPERVLGPTDFLRRETPRDALIAGDPHFLRYGASLGARRVLIMRGFNDTPDWSARWGVLNHAVTAGGPKIAIERFERYGVDYLLVTPGFLEDYPEVDLETLDRRPDLERVHTTRGPGGDDVVIYRFVETTGQALQESS
jgi:hypothetical protein